jgi:hypothetical protein
VEEEEVCLDDGDVTIQQDKAVSPDQVGKRKRSGKEGKSRSRDGQLRTNRQQDAKGQEAPKVLPHL